MKIKLISILKEKEKEAFEIIKGNLEKENINKERKR